MFDCYLIHIMKLKNVGTQLPSTAWNVHQLILLWVCTFFLKLNWILQKHTNSLEKKYQKKEWYVFKTLFYTVAFKFRKRAEYYSNHHYRLSMSNVWARAFLSGAIEKLSLRFYFAFINWYFKANCFVRFYFWVQDDTTEILYEKRTFHAKIKGNIFFGVIFFSIVKWFLSTKLKHFNFF